MAIVKLRFTILIGIVYAVLVITALSVIQWNEISTIYAIIDVTALNRLRSSEGDFTLAARHSR